MKMFLNKTRYSLVIVVQFCLLMADLFINAFADEVRYNSGYVLMVYIIQDSLQILAMTVLLVSIFQTKVFQAGFVELLYDRFRVTLFIAMAYLLLSITLQIVLLTARWSEPLIHNWPTFSRFLFGTQRFMSCFYYYFYKRSALRLSDPRFYDDVWINSRMNSVS